MLNRSLAQVATTTTVVVIEAPAFAAETADRGVAYQETPTLPPPESYYHYLAIRAELDATYNARQCIIDFESRAYGVTGMYTAENGGTPANEAGRNKTDASGAYQWKNPSWREYLPWVEQYFGLILTSPEEDAKGARNHAAYASPYTQDLVTSWALLHPDLAQNHRPWTHKTCWAIIGSPKLLRTDGPESHPTPFIQAQVVYGTSITPGQA